MEKKKKNKKCPSRQPGFSQPIKRNAKQKGTDIPAAIIQNRAVCTPSYFLQAQNHPPPAMPAVAPSTSVSPNTIEVCAGLSPNWDSIIAGLVERKVNEKAIVSLSIGSERKNKKNQKQKSHMKVLSADTAKVSVACARKLKILMGVKISLHARANVLTSFLEYPIAFSMRDLLRSEWRLAMWNSVWSSGVWFITSSLEWSLVERKVNEKAIVSLSIGSERKN